MYYHTLPHQGNYAFVVIIIIIITTILTTIINLIIIIITIFQMSDMIFAL